MSEDKSAENISKDNIASNFTDTTHDSKSNSLPLSCRNASSSSSVKLRKSSNIFSSLVKKARRKKTANKSGSEELKNLHISSQNLSCASTASLGVHVEEVEISCQNYEKKCTPNQEMFWDEKHACSETNTSNHSLSNKTPKKSLGGSQHSSQNFRDNPVQTSQNCYANKAAVAEEKSDEDIAITSFIPFQTPVLNVSLADGLQYIQETVSSLHESENHITGLLAKYIQDQSVQKQLLAALSQHSKLQWDAERRSCSLANDMWMQQLEIGRAQEKILQGSMNALVKQNRQLQVENENLYRKHEKAVKMLRGFDNRPRCQEHDAQVDYVLRHNEKLQVKLETVFKRCESLEAELLIFQQQNDSMEQQLRNCTAKMQNMKALIYKMKTEYELQESALHFKLETKEQLLKEALDAGDILVEDLDSLKRQLKNNMPFRLNWSKFKVRGSCLTDLIHLCRSCINELSKEILNVHNEIALKDKDISVLHTTNTKLQENLKSSTKELEIMAKRFEETFVATTSVHLNEQKYQLLENDFKALEDQIEELKAQLDKETSLRLQSIAEFEDYKKEAQEKDDSIKQVKMLVTNVTTENCSLKRDIEMLDQLLKQTGAGDISREIENNQQEIEHVHRELRKIHTENRILLTQLGSSQHENAVLITNQESTHKNLQKQNKELERITEEVQAQRQKYDAEHQTVLSLQSERKRYLEEKNILKSIIHHLKNEVSKIKHLEQNLANVTTEASKLGLVAEYNKQQGEKLKNEVLERESVIIQLKSSVQQLNELHMQNAQEKISLCYELSEVCQLKEKMSEVLNTEVQKNVELGQTKEAMVKSVNSQIQKIEEKQKNERTAIRILLKDIKTIAEEKEQLTTEKNKLLVNIEHLSIKLADKDKKCDELTNKLGKMENENAELRKNLELLEKKNNEINENWKNEESKYDLNIRQLRKLIELLRKDKNELQNSNGYLKNNIEKLIKDLNLSRENEKTVSDLINKTKQQQEETQKALNEQTELVRNLTREKDALVGETIQLTDEKAKLTNETNYLNRIMDKVVNDFEKSISVSEEKDRLFKNEFDESKKLLHTYAQEIQDLNKTIDLKEKKIEELNEIVREEQCLQKRFLKLQDVIEHLKTESKKLKKDKASLEQQINDLQDGHERSIKHIKNVEEEMVHLENQLKMVLAQKEDDYLFYKKHIAELVKAREEFEDQNQVEMHTLRQQLQDVHNKLMNEKAAYETLSQIHKEVSGKFMKSIKDLVDVKNSKQEVSDRFTEIQAILKGVENEKEELNNKLNKLVEELGMSKHLTVQLNEENNLLEQSYNKALDKCVGLEYQMKRMELDHIEHKNKELNLRSQSSDWQAQLQQEMENSKREIELASINIHKLKMEISALEQELTVSQIERSEITLELHETKKKWETEKSLSEQLKNTHKLLLAAVLQLKEEGKVDSSDCIHLLHMVRSTTSLVLDGDSISIKCE